MSVYSKILAWVQKMWLKHWRAISRRMTYYILSWSWITFRQFGEMVRGLLWTGCGKQAQEIKGAKNLQQDYAGRWIPCLMLQVQHMSLSYSPFVQHLTQLEWLMRIKTWVISHHCMIYSDDLLLLNMPKNTKQSAPCLSLQLQHATSLGSSPSAQHFTQLDTRKINHWNNHWKPDSNAENAFSLIFSVFNPNLPGPFWGCSVSI